MCDLPVRVQRVMEAMHGMARHAVTATSVGLVPLDREQRLALLSSIDSTAVLVALGEMQAELDAAMLSSAETLPIEAMRIVDSQWYEPVRQQLVAGHRLAPRQTMVRLMREIIEAGEGPRVGIEDDDARLQLLLSVNEDHDTPSGRAARFNAMDMRQMDVEMRGMSEDELIEFANQMAVDQAASMMFNASRLPEQMKCMTHEFWYQPWAEKVGDQLGATPSDTFREATGMSMDEFLRAGDVIVSVLRTGRACFDIGALHRHGVSDEVVQTSSGTWSATSTNSAPCRSRIKSAATSDRSGIRSRGSRSSTSATAQCSHFERNGAWTGSSGTPPSSMFSRAS